MVIVYYIQDCQFQFFTEFPVNFPVNLKYREGRSYTAETNYMLQILPTKYSKYDSNTEHILNKVTSLIFMTAYKYQCMDTTYKNKSLFLSITRRVEQ